MTRMLKAPTPLPAVLPHGPMEKQERELDMLEQHYKPLELQHTSTTLGKLAELELGAAGGRGEWCDVPKSV